MELFYKLLQTPDAASHVSPNDKIPVEVKKRFLQGKLEAQSK